MFAPAHLKRGEKELALADFSEAIKRDPKNGHAWANRGSLYEDMGRFDPAISDYEHLIALQPGRGRRLSIALPTPYLKHGDFDRAVAGYNEAINHSPNDAVNFANRGDAYRGQATTKDHAIADYDRAIALNGKLAFAFAGRGLVYARKGDDDRAIADFDNAIGLDPAGVAAYAGRGAIFLMRQQRIFDRAIEDYTYVLALDPNDAAVHNNRGNAFASKGDTARAIADYDAAAQLRPELSETVRQSRPRLSEGRSNIPAP